MPSQPRFFPGQRWLNIGLRALHLLGVAGTGSALLMPMAADGPWHRYLILTLVTGVAMSLTDAWSDRCWLYRLSGQAVLLKLLLLGLIPVWPIAGPVLFASVVLLSAVVSHAPAGVRHYSLLHGRTLERPDPRRPGR